MTSHSDRPVSADQPSAEVVLSVTGQLVECGDIGRPSRGVLLECGERYVEVQGLDKAECRALAKLLTQEVILRITPVRRI